MGRDSDTEGSEEGSEFSDDAEDLFKRRRCTDCFCCLIFVAAMAFLVVVFGYGIVNGNPRKLNHGLDAQGNQCGVSPSVEDKPLLYFCPVVTSASLHSVNMDDPVCVGACPTDVGGILEPALVPQCQHPETYATSQVGHRYCLPAGGAEAEARQKVQEGMKDLGDNFLWALSHVSRAWPVLLVVVLVSTAMGYVFLFLLKTVARCIIFVCAILGFIAFAALGAVMWVKSDGLDDGNLGTTFKVLAVVCWFLSVVVMSCMCCCGGEIDMSTAAMGQAAIVIWKMPVLLLSPMIKTIVKTIMFILLVIGFIGLLSTGEVTGVGRERHMTYTTSQKLYLGGYVFCAFWVMAFVSALYQFAIAYAVSYYYVAEEHNGKKDVSPCSVFEGVSVGIRYHGGSLAMGSAIIAVLELIQRIIEWAEKKNQETGGNQLVSCILATTKCCCCCLEEIIQFINKNAYINMALTSEGFCTSVKEVGHIIIDHGAAMAILNGATYVFQIVGLASVTATCGLIAFSMLGSQKYTDPYSPDYIDNSSVAIVLCCLLAFLVTWAFMAIFDMTSDTLLICLAKDSSRDGGARHRHHNQEFADMFDEAQRKALEKKKALAESEDEKQ